MDELFAMTLGIQGRKSVPPTQFTAQALKMSVQGSAMAIARSNVRIALIIATGELQKAAGPDQRVTAACQRTFCEHCV
jgi:hypothetical protein